MNKDYYQILEVPKSASQDDIKKSYRKLAKKYHPDANPGIDTDTKMKEINAAYDTLGDESKRAQYDRFGSNPQYTYTNQQSSAQDPFAQFFEEMMRQQQQQQQYQQSRRTYTVRPFGIFRFMMYMFILDFILSFIFRF
jgi:DnaJ-class molecular chaperone